MIDVALRDTVAPGLEEIELPLLLGFPFLGSRLLSMSRRWNSDARFAVGIERAANSHLNGLLSIVNRLPKTALDQGAPIATNVIASIIDWFGNSHGGNMARDDLLFFKADSFSVQDHQRKQMEDEIASMDGNRLLNTNVGDLVSYIMDKFRIDVPVLDEANMNADQHEAQRDVSGDPRRMLFHSDRGPVYVTGTEVVVEVPFSGDPEMFKVRPSTSNMNPPRGDVRGNTITFRSWGENMNAQQVRSELDRWLADINQYLQWQRNSFKNFNDFACGVGEDSDRATA